MNNEKTDYFQAIIERESSPRIAFIREEDCIGCTKCIQACPVEAIVGSSKQMHTVLISDCTGCGLCVPPCPTDCIDLLPRTPLRPEQLSQQLAAWEHQYQQREIRLSRAPQKPMGAKTAHDRKKQEIVDAISRSKAKRAGLNSAPDKH